MGTRRLGDHAVVIGASVSGLLAATVLAEFYQRVTLVDRDELDRTAHPRRGVRQGRHAHVLLGSGLQAIEGLLPGITGELSAEGAQSCRALAEIRFVVAGHQLTQQAEGAPVLLASRPLLEAHLRRRVLALPNVTMRARCAAAGLRPSATGDRVSGVIVRDRRTDADEHLSADLVTVATGRSAQLPAWLDELGYPRPAEDRLHVDLRYVSRRLHLSGPPPGGDKLIGIGARPGLPRGLMLIAQEDHWMLTASGYGVAHHPPTEEQTFSEFVASVAPADVLAAIQASTPLGELVSHHFPANQRRRYERLRRFPAGLLALGDALASFNPLYGQGMSVAALEALKLRRCLQVGERQLARRFFRAAAKVVDQAWEMAVGGDLFLPEVQGARSLGVRLTNAYVRRLLLAAEHDPAVAAVYNQVGDLLVPAGKVLQPAVLRRVLRPTHFSRKHPVAGLTSARKARI